jgi:hypothetical protein
MDTLAPHLPRTIATSSGNATLSLLTAASLPPHTRDTLYSLFDANIGPLAKGTSMEHEEQAKREEMFDPDARFLLLSRTAMPGTLREQGQVEEGELLGFVSFRFDTEETMGTRDVEVVYWSVGTSSRTQEPFAGWAAKRLGSGTAAPSGGYFGRAGGPRS